MFVWFDWFYRQYSIWRYFFSTEVHKHSSLKKILNHFQFIINLNTNQFSDIEFVAKTNTKNQ